MEVGLSIGSNLNNRLDNIETAIKKITEIDGVKASLQASVYETEPVDVLPEYSSKKFLNTFVVIEYNGGDLERLSEKIHNIEAEMGRIRTAQHNLPRLIDIDLIYADQLSYNSPDLIIPHPRWAQRRFVVQPLSEIRPDLVLPGNKHSVSEILSSLPINPAARLQS